MKIGLETRKTIDRVSVSLNETFSRGEIPSGGKVRTYFELYDRYRRLRYTHGMPGAAKRAKLALIEFLVARLHLSSRKSTDPVAAALPADHPVFPDIALVALDAERIVAFHVAERSFSWMKPIRRELVRRTTGKGAIADLFDECRARGIATAAEYLAEHRPCDHFRRFLDPPLAA